MLTAYYSDTVPIPLPAGHPFPQQKYALLRARLQVLVERGELQLLAADRVDTAALLRVHTAEYVRRATEGQLTRQEQRELGFPWSPQYAERARRSVGASVAAARSAWQQGRAAHLAGGTHHAQADRPRGFCLFNDVAVAIAVLRAEGICPRVLIVDADVHQGDGTAALFADDPSVFTLSIHGLRNYPLVKMTSDLDVALPDGSGDEPYLAALDEALAAAWSACQPQMVYYLAGADPFVGDKYGRLALTKAGLAERDRRVVARCAAQQVPIATVMAGGYARPIDDTVDIHVATIELLARWPSAVEPAASD